MLDSDNIVKIVVVSNDLIMPESLENMLDSQKFVLESIKSDPRLIAGIRRVDPDIFVIDGNHSRDEVLSICKNIRNYSGTPILVLAADHKPEFVKQVLDGGADEFLMKPVSGNILVAYLNTLIRRARAEKEAAISIVKGDGGDSQSRLLTY